MAYYGQKGNSSGVYPIKLNGKADPALLDNGIDATKISSGEISNEMFDNVIYLENVSSDIQAQLDAITDDIITQITSNDNSLLVTSNSNSVDLSIQNVAVNTIGNKDITTAEFSRLSGVSANIQVQINNLTSGFNNFSAFAVATENKVISSPGATGWDSVTLSNGDIVFLLPTASGGYQTTAYEGGLYIYNGPTSLLTRIPGMNTWAEITGSRINIGPDGTVFKNTVWLNTNNKTGTINLTPVTYIESYNNYMPGDNIDITGNVISLISNPDLKGNPTAPTPANTDSSTRIATTASILNKLLTGLNSDQGRIAETDSILDAFSKLRTAPEFTLLNLTSNNTPLIFGFGANTVTFNILGLTGANTVNFPGGGVISTTVIGNNSPTTGNALSNITTSGVQQYITVINQLLTGISITNSALTEADTILSGLGKAQGQINAKANLNSPNLTGTPTAPTPAGTDNSQKLATTAFILAKTLDGFSALNSAIVATDTIIQFANKAQGQINAANSAIALKADLASPALTGVPTAPTASQGTGTTQLATTSYVDTGLATKEPTITTLPVTKGGLGLNTIPAGAILVSNTTDTLSALNGPANNTWCLTSNGSTSAPSYSPPKIIAEVSNSTNNSGLTTATDIIIACGANNNIMEGYYVLTVENGTINRFVMLYQLIINKLNFSTQPTLMIIDIFDSSGIINKSNVSSYLTFMIHSRTALPQYLALTLRMSGGLIFGLSQLRFTCTAYGNSYNTNDLTITPFISTPFSGLSALYPPVSSVTVSTTTVLATTSYVDAGLALKAPLASPALTGVPTAPTASPGTSTTQLATTAFVTTADALKANIASPTFTGIPAGPTASQGTGTTQLATTSYVDTGLATFNNINGLKLSWASATTLGVTSGYWNTANSSIMRTLSGAVTINIANVGVVNGLDSGAAANNTNYYVYVIAHGTTPALNGAILSTNSTTPTLPSGYTVYRYIGRVRRDGSGVFIPFIQTGNNTIRTITFTGTSSLTQVLSGGTSASFTTLSLSSFIPPGVKRGVVRFDYTSTSAFATINIRETGSSVTTTNGLISFGPGLSGAVRGILPFICNSSQSVDYLLSAAGDTANLYIFSYEEEL